MDNKSKMKKEIDDFDTPPPHKGGLKYLPKVSRKKDPKNAPKMELQEESKAYTVDKDLMMKLRPFQSPDALRKRANADKKVNKDYTNSAESAAKLPKGYVEPWDYHSNYPVALPLRRPYSGNPANLDEEEFWQSSSDRVQDGELTAAEELGLMARMNESQLLFLQLPVSLPLPRAEQVTEEISDTNEDVNTQRTKSELNDRKRRHQSIHGCKLEDLPGGLMGKIHVYKSGKVKIRLGDALFNVSAGSNCTFAQDVVVINTREKHCCRLGEVSKRAILTPDIDQLLDSMEKTG